MKRTKLVLLAVPAILLCLCLVASVVSALLNRSLLANYNLTGPAPLAPERLAALDKLRLAEALHLKDTLGDQVWPGWRQAAIPVVLWTSGAEFLTGVSQPPQGLASAGPTAWQRVAGDNFEGQAYFRRVSSDPQNFAVPLGDGWAASIATKEESDRFLIDHFHSMLPGPLKAIFPYRALILPSEVQMTGVLHETFHAYQATMVPERLKAAEAAHRLGQRYSKADARMGDSWPQEIDLLIQALRAKSDADARQLAGQFLAERSGRRKAAELPADLVDYERQLEWEEGLAKYVEMTAWQRALRDASYKPLPGMAGDPYFRHYRTFDQRFDQELTSMRNSARQEGEMRFYYAGMAQAMLLDRLAPGWQSRAFDDGVWLEDLLALAAPPV